MWLFVGSTPSTGANNHKAGYSASTLVQNVAAFGSAQRATPLQRLLEFLNHRFQTRLQFGTRHLALAEVPPQPEHVFHRLQPRLTDRYRRATAIDAFLKITLQVHHPNTIDKLRTTLVIPYRSTTRPYAPRLPRRS